MGSGILWWPHLFPEATPRTFRAVLRSLCISVLGLELPTWPKHMLPVTTEAWHSSSLWKGLGVGSGPGPCQGHCRWSGGRKLPGQDSKTTGFCHVFCDARFLIDGFATTSIALRSAARPGWLKMPDAWGQIIVPGLGALSFFPVGEWEWSYCILHYSFVSPFIFCKLNARHFLF